MGDVTGTHPPRATGLSDRTRRVPRPISNSALERLGRRLVATDHPQQSDIDELHLLLAAYSPVLARTVDAVTTNVGVVSASRIKNTGTILEKLRRGGGHTLSTIQDLAGLRVVIDGGRAEQDRVVQRLVAAFSDTPRPPRVVDRRAQPVKGYRAVHVIVYPDGFPIEIQVRTRWQHQWAEWYERLADQYGRGIRYGQPPLEGGQAAQQTVDWMLGLADQIAQTEQSGGTPPLSLVTLDLLDQVIKWLESRQQGT
jgi:ppGpp synthetase/RelA/SpoT-type nucleotidyltranferase